MGLRFVVERTVSGLWAVRDQNGWYGRRPVRAIRLFDTQDEAEAWAAEMNAAEGWQL